MSVLNWPAKCYTWIFLTLLLLVQNVPNDILTCILIPHEYHLPLAALSYPTHGNLFPSLTFEGKACQVAVLFWQVASWALLPHPLLLNPALISHTLLIGRSWGSRAARLLRYMYAVVLPLSIWVCRCVVHKKILLYCTFKWLKSTRERNECCFFFLGPYFYISSLQQTSLWD